MAPIAGISIKRTIRRHQLREIVPLADSTISKWNSAENFLDAWL